MKSSTRLRTTGFTQKEANRISLPKKHYTLCAGHTKALTKEIRDHLITR